MKCLIFLFAVGSVFFTTGCITWFIPPADYDPTAAIKLTCLETEFNEYWKEAETLDDKDVDRHLLLFRKHFYKQKEVKKAFHQAVLGLPADQPSDEKLKKALARAVPLWRKHHKAISKGFADFENVIVDEMVKYIRSFKDFYRYQFDIYGLPTFAGLNGALRTVDGDEVIIFGIDSIAIRNDDLPLLFSHEFIHALQNRLVPDFSSQGQADPAVLMAVKEGLSVYGSGHFLRDKIDDVLFDKDLTKWCDANKHLGIIKKFREEGNLFLPAVVKKNMNQWSSFEHRWFKARKSIHGDGKEYGYPERAGYCIGERFIAELAVKHKFEDLLKWKFPKYKSEFDRVYADWIKKKS